MCIFVHVVECSIQHSRSKFLKVSYFKTTKIRSGVFEKHLKTLTHLRNQVVVLLDVWVSFWLMIDRIFANNLKKVINILFYKLPSLESRVSIAILGF
jgi:hypothetical protein